MGLVFAVQASVGSMVSILAWMVSGSMAAASAMGAMGLAVVPNLVLFRALAVMSSDWRPLGLLAGKFLSLLVSVVGLVWWSQAWGNFVWPWALASLTSVVVAWLSAPVVLTWSERRATEKRIDEIVARSDRSLKD